MSANAARVNALTRHVKACKRCLSDLGARKFRQAADSTPDLEDDTCAVAGCIRLVLARTWHSVPGRTAAAAEPSGHRVDGASTAILEARVASARQRHSCCRCCDRTHGTRDAVGCAAVAKPLVLAAGKHGCA